MKHLYYTGSAVLFLCHFAFSAITYWHFFNRNHLFPSDSLQYSYETDVDTTYSRIFFKAGSPSLEIDSTQDILIYNIMVIDNNREEVTNQSCRIIADRNPQKGIFCFNPGSVGLAPGLYLVELSDRDGSLFNTIRIAAPSNPFRTVSGTVSPPEGASTEFISLTLSRPGTDQKAAAWTDSLGKYTITCEKNFIEATGGEVVITIDSRFPDFSPFPAFHSLDLKKKSAVDIDFTFLKTTCAVKGAVQAGEKRLQNIQVVLQDREYNDITGTFTDSEGEYTLRCTPGRYLVSVGLYKKGGIYLSPAEKNVEVRENATVFADFHVASADTFISGRVAINGTTARHHPARTFAVQAYNEHYGSSWTATDKLGNFFLPVAAVAEKYIISVVNRSDYPLPENMIFENGRNWKVLPVGGSARFNLIAKPAGGISGIVKNTSTLTSNKIFIRLFIPEKDISFTFKTENEGRYTFRGIPDGTYRAEAGMSIEGENEWNWKLYDRFLDENGEPGQVVIKRKVTPGIDFTFSSIQSSDAGQPGTTLVAETGTASLSLSLIDSTSAIVEKGGVLFLKELPEERDFLNPVLFIPFEKPEGTVELRHIPNRNLFVAVELFGTVMGQPGRYLAFVSDDSGDPFSIDFSSHEKWNASVTVFDHDLRIHPESEKPSASFGLQLLNKSNERNGIVCLQSADP